MKNISRILPRLILYRFTNYLGQKFKWGFVMERDENNLLTGEEATDELEYSAAKSKKDFKFLKPIDELYDEKSIDSIEETDQKEFYVKPVKVKKVKTRRKGCLLAILYTAVIVAIAGVVAAFAVSAFLDMTGIGKPNNKRDVTIKQGAGSAAAIANTLKADGIIDNPISFRLYVKYKHASGFNYGDHTLNSNMGYGEIVTILKQSKASLATVKVTIPEGKTIQWIDQKLADEKVCDPGEFITACKTGGFNFTFDKQIVNSKDRLYKYEGYLFPDTYDFYVGSTGKKVAQKILDNFTVKFDKTMTDRAAAIGYSVDQVIILASIIQSETGNKNEMPHVSSVFHNRLEKPISDIGGKFLQSDATVFYVTKDVQPVLAQSSIGNASAYNTYKYQGLPPGAICNPGIDAINAALYPADKQDYYFVTDINHKYYYAATLSQHNANVKKALSTKAATGTDVYK
jgi:UPF0755 protein